MFLSLNCFALSLNHCGIFSPLHILTHLISQTVQPYNPSFLHLLAASASTSTWQSESEISETSMREEDRSSVRDEVRDEDELYASFNNQPGQSEEDGLYASFNNQPGQSEEDDLYSTLTRGDDGIEMADYKDDKDDDENDTDDDDDEDDSATFKMEVNDTYSNVLEGEPIYASVVKINKNDKDR